MNKTELVAEVAKRNDLTKTDAMKVVESLFETITAALVAGDKVHLLEFGTFATKERAARSGTSPLNGKSYDSPAKKVPTFKASKGLKTTVSM